MVAMTPPLGPSCGPPTRRAFFTSYTGFLVCGTRPLGWRARHSDRNVQASLFLP